MNCDTLCPGLFWRGAELLSSRLWLIAGFQGQAGVHDICVPEDLTLKGESSRDPHGPDRWPHATAGPADKAAHATTQSMRDAPVAPRAQYEHRSTNSHRKRFGRSGAAVTQPSDCRPPCAKATRRTLISPNARVLNDQDENAEWSLSLGYSGRIEDRSGICASGSGAHRPSLPFCTCGQPQRALTGKFSETAA
jgi:hypothetical protein